MYNIQVKKYEGKEVQWKELSTNSPHSNLSHLIEWNIILNKVYGYKSRYFVVEEDDKIFAAFPSFIVDSLLFGKRLISVPIMEYGGIMYSRFDREAFALLVEKVIEEGELEEVDYIELRSPSPAFIPILEKYGFVVNNNYNYCTFIINLNVDEYELWKNLDKSSVKWGINKAEKEGIVIQSGRDLNDIKAFYDIYLEVMKKHGSPPEPFSYFVKIYDSLYPENLQFWFATINGEKIASSVYFLKDNDIYWAYSVSKKEHLKCNPNNLLLWHVIKWGNKNGYENLIMGRTRKDSGVYHFKKRWGGKYVPLPVYCYLMKKHKLPELDPDNGMYKILTSIWSKLPMSLSRWIGPKIRAGIG